MGQDLVAASDLVFQVQSLMMPKKYLQPLWQMIQQLQAWVHSYSLLNRWLPTLFAIFP